MSTSEPPKSRPRTLKILGERNSGTTYVEPLLARNLEVRPLPGTVPKSIQRWMPEGEWARDVYFLATRRWNLGWKHAVPPAAAQLARARPDRRAVLFVTVTKNPYAWLLSLYRRPHHSRQSKVGDFTEFLSTPWPTVGRENRRAAFESPVAMWNLKSAAHLALADRAQTVSTRYEDWLADPIGGLERLCRDHGLGHRCDPFRNIEEAVKRSDRGRRFGDYRDYYLNERWRAELDAEATACINARVDHDLMSRFGYARIETDG